MREHLIIVGGGQAAAQAAASLRQGGYDERISLLTDEAHLPYQRPPLSKGFLAGEIEPERLLLKPEQFYLTREIEVRTATRVDAIDASASRVRLADGSELDFSALLLATGSEPNRLSVPGAELDGIHYLRSIDDVESIRRELSPGAELVIVGGGYIGLEAAAVARGAGLNVTVLEAAPNAMSRTVCPETARFFADYHKGQGVELQFDSALARFVGDSRVRSAEARDGRRFECELAIVAIGISPRVSLAEAAGLDIDDGIAVDACGKTAAPGIFAAGDCTSHPHPWVGRRIRLESVHNAIEQGKAAAASIRGRDEAFDAIPWFWSDQYDLKLQIAGVSSGYDETVTRGRMDDGSFSVFYLDAGRVIAVDSVNDPRTFILAKQRLADKPAWSREAIADSSCDLNAL